MGKGAEDGLLEQPKDNQGKMALFKGAFCQDLKEELSEL